MKRLNTWHLLAILAALTLGTPGAGANSSAPSETPADQATGYVFHDVNGNGERDRGEEGIADVAVSNGREVVTTDESGRYRLPVGDDTAIFVIKPRGWMTPLDENNLPRFYYLHKPDGSPEGLRYPGVEPTGPLPESVDFPLIRREEPDRFRVILFGDPQPRNQQQANYFTHDIVEELVGVEAAFGVSMGDITSNDLSLFKPINQAVGQIGVPWHNVHGNHDMNFDVAGDELADETFERVYGPGTYAFNHGPVHFIVLDNVVYHGQETEGRRYTGGLSERQMRFIENDLAEVPEDRLVVLMMHIPLEQAPQAKRLLEMLAERPHSLSFSAHTHVQEHQFMGPDEHHHLNLGTTSGTWWRGALDEVGIPHTMMRDGTPNGYSFVTFDGSDYSVRYKVARRPADYQMNIYAPEAVEAGATQEAEVWANVFAGSEKSTVRMRVGDDGQWIEMEKTAAKDPYYQRVYDRETALAEAAGPDTLRFDPVRSINRDSTHLWRANLPADLPPGSHLIHVRATDMFGQTHDDHRIIRVTGGS